MAKKGYIESSLIGLRSFAETLNSLKSGRVEVGIFAGENARTAAGGAGSKPGFYKADTTKATVEALKAGRTPTDASKTNAEIGAKMEFGDPTPQVWIDRKGIERHVTGIPPRSFLRSPIHLHGDRIMKFAKNEATEELKGAPKNSKRTATRLLSRVGIAAETVVQEAFDTQGDGSWDPNSPETMDAKDSDHPLIDTGQLRRSIDSRAVL